MKLMKTSVSVVLILTGNSAAYCQATDAARYVNAQGIEVIQARRPQTQSDSHVAASKIAALSTTPALPNIASSDSRLQISAKVQLSRDQDRLAILNQELATENKAFENKIRIMQTPAMKEKLSPEEQTRLQETLVDHERNMRALKAEIGRVR